MKVYHILLALICLSFDLSCFALYRKSSEVSSAPFAKAVVQKFGMAIGGLITIDYNVVPQSSESSYDGYTLILVVTENERSGFFNEIADSIVSNPSVVANLCMQPSMARIVASGSGSFNMTVTSNYESEQYSILLMQCRSGVVTNPLNIDLEINMKNPHPTDNSYSHLGIEDVNLIRLFGGEGILYMLFILILAGQFIFYRSQIKGVHILFAITLLATFIVVMLDYNCKLHYSSNEAENYFT